MTREVPASCWAGSGGWVSVCRVDEVGVGDGLFFTGYGQPWVVTQPTAGWSGGSPRGAPTREPPTCNDVIRRPIQCPVHGSRYHLRTGLQKAVLT